MKAVCTIALMAALTTGCYTTSNVATVTPLGTTYPVSASAQYVDSDGTVVDEDHYQVLDQFEFTRTVEGRRHDDNEARLELEPDLNRVMGKADGHAVTNLRIEAQPYDAGSHSSAAGWKILGWTFGLTGATCVAAGLAVDNPDVSPTFMTLGGVTLGIGVLSYLVSFATNDPAQWNLHVTGQVVRRNSNASSSAQEPSKPVAAQ